MTKEFTGEDIRNVIDRIESNRDTSISEFQTQVLNNYTLLYDRVKTENNNVYGTYDVIKNKSSANSQQSKYTNQSAYIIQKIYGVLFWIYLVVAVVLGVLVYLYMKDYTMYYKIFIILLILLFPFYIYILEYYVFSLATYIYSLALSVVYVNNL